MKFLQSGGRLRFVHVDTAQLEENHEFQLTPLSVTNASLGENIYKLKLLEDPLQEVSELSRSSRLVSLFCSQSLYLHYLQI